MKPGTLIKYFLVWQAAVVAVTLTSPYLLPLREAYLGGATQTYLTNPLLYSRANFDGVHYLGIASAGYGYAQQAFFPLYPLLIQKLTPMFSSPVSAGIAVSLISFVLGLYFLVKLLSLDESETVVRLTVLALLFFPTSFFFGFVYTEGLFFLLLILAFYSARTRHWWLAGLIAGLAGYTRFVGIFLLPALFIEWYQLGPSRRLVHLLPIIASCTGLIIYMRYLQHTAGDPLAFIHVQSLFGQGRSEKVILLYQVFWRYLKMIFTVNRADPLYLTIVLEALTGVVFLITTIYSFIKLRLSYAVFNVLAYILPTFTGNFVSIPRYVLICFPSFVLLGRFLSHTHSINRRILAMSCTIVFFIFLSLFVRGYWVS